MKTDGKAVVHSVLFVLADQRLKSVKKSKKIFRESFSAELSLVYTLVPCCFLPTVLSMLLLFLQAVPRCRLGAGPWEGPRAGRLEGPVAPP